MSIAQTVVDQAESAIKKYGTSVVLTNHVSVYDESTGTITKSESQVPAKAVLEYNTSKVNTYTSMGVANATGVVYDVKVILPASSIVNIGDSVAVGNQVYSVGRVDPIYVQDLIATYEVYGKRE